MENQINVGDQNTQQIGQNPIGQSVSIPEKPKKNYVIIGTAVLVCFVIFGFGGYYLGKQSSRNSETVSNNTLNSANTSNTPTQPYYPSIIPTISPTTQKQYGPESLWIGQEGRAGEFLNSKVVVSVPTGWTKINCGGTHSFNPVGGVKGVDSCGIDPSSFTIDVFPDSPYGYDLVKSNSNVIISNLKQNLSFGGKKAVQFDQEVIGGQAQGKYKETIIFYSDDTYLYVVLNKLAEESVYQEFLNNIKFN